MTEKKRMQWKPNNIKYHQNETVATHEETKEDQRYYTPQQESPILTVKIVRISNTIRPACKVLANSPYKNDRKPQFARHQDSMNFKFCHYDIGKNAPRNNFENNKKVPYRTPMYML